MYRTLGWRGWRGRPLPLTMRVSPLRKLYQLAEASLIPYGPAEENCLVAETFGDIELEYAAIRKSCILLDLPQRGVLEITGNDRIEFLNRMVTQELKPKGGGGLSPFHTVKAFWLNRKGRIDADLRLIELGNRMLADVDVLAADRALKGLASFAVMDDVAFKDVSETTHRLALHGPTGPALIQAVSKMVSGPAVIDLPQGSATIVSIRGHEVVIDRDDSTGEIGLELTMPAAAATEIFQHLVEVGQVHDDGNGGGEPASKYRLRPAGWHAYNIARIEAGRPLYNLDFGPNSLPHETGILRDRVSFTKGCYLGQEVVARMESRGHSKQMLLAIKCEASRPIHPPESQDTIPPRLPVTGSRIWQVDKPDSDPIGAVTSSTLSPMLGSTPVCFAMHKHEFAKPGLDLLVEADGERIRGKTQDLVAFWKKS